MPMFGGRGYSPRVSHPNYAGGLAQLGQTIGQGIQRGQKDAKFKDWKSGVHAVEEDSGGDENLILEALWRGSELEDPRANAVMQQLIPQYQGVLDQRAAAEEAARADAERNKNFDRAQQIAAGGDRVGAIQWLVRQGMDAGDATRAFPEEKDPRTTLQKNYDAAVKQGYPGTLMDYQKDTRPGGDTILLGDGPRGTGLAYDAVNQMEPKKDFSFRWKDPNDTSQGIVRDEYGLPKQFPLPGTEGTVSEAEAKQNNILFAGERIMETVTPEMLEAQGGLFNHIATQIPWGAGNYLLDSDFQIGRVAISRFVESLLRQATGAATNADELKTYREDYGPLPGDKPETVKWKLEQLVGKVQASQRQAGQDVTAKLPEQWGRLWGKGEGSEAAPAAPAAPLDPGVAEKVRAIAGAGGGASPTQRVQQMTPEQLAARKAQLMAKAGAG